MKLMMLSLLLTLGWGSGAEGDKGPAHCLQAFVQAADNQDADAMDKLLHPAYRIVMIAPSGQAVTVDRDTYLSKIRGKEWGGDRREIEVLELRTEGNRATAEVRLSGESADFHSWYSFVREGAHWLLVQDLVRMVPHE